MSESNLLTQVLKALSKNHLVSSIISPFSKMRSGIFSPQESRIQILYFPTKYSNNYFSAIFFHKLVYMESFYILCMLCKLCTMKRNPINSFWLLNLGCFFYYVQHWSYIFMWSDFMAWSNSCTSDLLCQQHFLSSWIYSSCLDSIN